MFANCLLETYLSFSIICPAFFSLGIITLPWNLDLPPEWYCLVSGLSTYVRGYFDHRNNSDFKWYHRMVQNGIIDLHHEQLIYQSLSSAFPKCLGALGFTADKLCLECYLICFAWGHLVRGLLSLSWLLIRLRLHLWNVLWNFLCGLFLWPDFDSS